ncbi:hypothetical protein, partial [Escherichia coli]|uniref:hypothetical protein n=1 Tax=Escherichia coli TaxID=562 RepID=UPI001BDB795D
FAIGCVGISLEAVTAKRLLGFWYISGKVCLSSNPGCYVHLGTSRMSLPPHIQITQEERAQ